MNKEDFKATWNRVKGEAKEQWANLTDDDIKKIDGKSDKLLATLQEKYGYTKEEAEKHMNSFMNKFKS